jgi:hypothetical protein
MLLARRSRRKRIAHVELFAHSLEHRKLLRCQLVRTARPDRRRTTLAAALVLNGREPRIGTPPCLGRAPPLI